MANSKTPMVRYQFRNGARIAGVKAQTVAKELSRIAETGGIKPEVLVDAARPVKAPLHKAFEWRDEIAGELYRLTQARHIIKSVQIVTDDELPKPMVTYCPQLENAVDGLGDYKLTDVVVGRPDFYAQALDELLKRVIAAQQAVEALRRAAAQDPNVDAERLARIGLAVTALQTAGAAVTALH